MKKIKFAALAAALVSAAVILTAPPAQAATAGNGVCEDGEFCLYYNSDNVGSLRDFSGSVSDYGTGTGCIKFVSGGAGQGQCVKNNAASAWNRKTVPVTVFYKSGYSGAIDNFSAGGKGNLRPALKNENAGHIIGRSGITTLEYGLYKSSSAHITAYFDGYLNTAGRHEGVDIALGVNYSVYALISGKVVRETAGFRGSGGLSTLAIYNSTLNVTIVYLHLNPSSVGVGTTVSKGQKLGVEDWRGISSSGAAHTHFEYRPGYHTAAAKSVDDYTLENPVPTGFWMNQGYNICCQFS